MRPRSAAARANPRSHAGKIALIALFTPCLASSGLAQTPSPIVPKERPDQGRAPQRSAPPPARAQAPLEAPAITPFVLREIHVEGSSLPPEALAAASRPLIGRTIDQAGLGAAADALAAAYKRSNIALYTIIVPDQDFADGRLRLLAVEGYLESVEFTGMPAGRNDWLTRSYADKLTTERPLRRDTLERYVSLLRDVPGLRPEIGLLEGGAEGAARLKVSAAPRRFSGAASINNRGTRFLGRTQVQLDGDAYGLLRPGDHSRLTVAFPTDIERFQYVALAHDQPVGTEGSRVQVSAGYLRTRPTTIPLRGEAKSLGLTFSHPLIRSYNRNLYVSVGLDGLNSDNAFLGQSFSDERTRALRALATYSWSSPRQFVSLNGGASFGLDAFGARVSSPNISQVDFVKANARVGYDVQVSRRVTVRARAAGQYSEDRLPASEQFSLGGDSFGRAYESAFVAGDTGYGGSLEVAWRPSGAPAALRGSEIYGFGDRGRVTYNARGGQARAHSDVASVGAGVRVVVKEKVQLDVEAARGLENPIPTVDRKDWRVVVGLRSVF
jgi:hemolysin activation/secretion protein